MSVPVFNLGRRFGLIILFLILSATTLIAVLYERHQSLHEMQRAALDLENDAELLAGELQSQIEHLKRDLELISQMPPVTGIIRSRQAGGVDPVDGSTEASWRSRLEQIFTAVIKKYPEYQQVRFIGAADQGREIVRVDHNGNEVVVIPEQMLQSKADRDYFQLTLERSPDQFCISNINLNRDFGQITTPHIPTLRISKPIYDANGEIFGMLVINRNVDPLFARLQGQLPSGVDLYITDEQGDYLYHPDPEKRFGFDLGKRYRLQDEFPSLSDLYEENVAVNQLQFDVTTSGSRQKVQFGRLFFDPVHPTRFLGLVLTVPHAQILALRDNRYMHSLFLIVGLGMMVLLATYLFLQRITRPLDGLTNSAYQIANGDYNIDIRNTGSRETEILAEALRHAANDVGQREQALALLNSELEQRVDTRTEELHKREKSLANAQRIASLGSWDWDLEQNHIVWSDEIYRIFGFNPRVIEGTLSIFFERVHPDDRAMVDETIKNAIRQQDGFEMEYRLLLPGDNQRVIHAEGEIIRDSAGKAIALHGTVLDITNRKQAENHSRLLASVFEHSLEGILITDLELKIIDVNPAFSRITGYAAEEAIGKTPKILSSGWHDDEHYQEIWRSLKECGRWQGEMNDRRKSGEIYTEWLTISCIYDDKGQPVNYVGVMNDITEKKTAEQRILRLAYYDSLTELANRRLFEDRLEQTLRLSRRKAKTVSVFYIDLDRFKPINDSLGHKAGDMLLKQVALRLLDCVRESDTVARLGGDEFAIILEDIDQLEVSHLAQTINKRLEQSYSLEGSEVFIGASIGISMFPNDGADSTSLVKHADIAMYRAKELGRNTYQFYLPEMNAGVEERLFLENALRYAIDRGELSLHYQPQVRLSDGKYMGAEALLRWQHPELGNVSPICFIPIAEDSGLINDIGRWVLEQACQQRQAWHHLVDDDFRIAVNLSARQFNTNVVSMVEDVLQRTGLEARYLDLEITESMVMQDADSAVHVLVALNELGVRVSIDDFGTGYSSLSYLKRFPLQKLKVDRSFITELPQNEEDAAITKAVIAMAKTLGLDVIAEGAETLEQIRFLNEQGCNQVQGYYCSRPLPVAEVDILLGQKYCAKMLNS